MFCCFFPGFTILKRVKKKENSYLFVVDFLVLHGKGKRKQWKADTLNPIKWEHGRGGDKKFFLKNDCKSETFGSHNLPCLWIIKASVFPRFEMNTYSENLTAIVISFSVK